MQSFIEYLRDQVGTNWVQALHAALARATTTKDQSQ